MLIHKGAEAHLFVEYWNSRIVLRKYRIPKKYRIPELDFRLRSDRTRHEARLISSAKQAGVFVPLIYFVDVPNTTIIMQFVPGKPFRDVLHERRVLDDYISNLFMQLGKSIALLHKSNIIHGDLTTSNMILFKDRLFLIDFGLGYFSSDIEDKAVDLHLLKTVLKSTHDYIFPESFDIILKAYVNEYGVEAKKIVDRIEDIERRGRYISER
ncbi:MAG: KEOPS complex kinase/ATPase Bud32 [Candidatus Asgardarchaeia archaeon]